MESSPELVPSTDLPDRQHPAGATNVLNALQNLPEEDRLRLSGQLQQLGLSFTQFESLLGSISTTTISGGVNLESRTASIGGSVVGRDSLVVNLNLTIPDRQAWQQVMPALAHYPVLREPLYAALRAGEPDLELDFAALAQRLYDRPKPGSPVEVAKREQAVYVPLALKFSRHRRVSAQALFEQDQTFDDIVEAVQAARAPHDAEPYPALVLLGAPGGGKSTALRHLTLECLNGLLADPGAHLPLFVSLGEYRDSALGKLRRAAPDDDLPLTPLNFLRAHWHAWLGDDGFERALETGRVWLILDGLNEIPDRDQRIPDWAAFFDPHTGAFAAPHRPNRAIIACRRADYGNRLDLPYLDLEELDGDRIRAFVGKRLEKLGPAARDEVLRRLEEDAKLREVVGNPFWLQMLTDYAEDHAGYLPVGRTDLIDWFVDKWLDYSKGRADLPPLPPDEIEALKTVLEPFVYWLLARSDNAPVEWSEAVQCCGGWGERKKEEALKRAERASLLVREAAGVKFYHQLILEYFAGRELARRFRRGDEVAAHWRISWEAWQFVNTAWRRLAEPPATRWEEATVFAAARPEVNFDVFVRAVLKENPPLAARCLLETGQPVADSLRDAVRQRLLDIVERRAAALGEVAEPTAQLALRIAAGHALGRLGDPRILAGRGQASWRALLAKQAPSAEAEIASSRKAATRNDVAVEVEFIEPRWCAVQAGPFTMGSNTGYDSEKPEHSCDVIKRDYAIGMFPVTNAEYDCFVKAGGYDTQDYWTRQGWEWRMQDVSIAQPPGWVFWPRDWAKHNIDAIRKWPERGIAMPDEVESWLAEAQRTDEELAVNWRRRELNMGRASNPWRDDRDLNGANQPVVGVCWYEAMAYCAWLTDVLRAAGRIRADQTVTLPSEPQWEKAARGVLPSPVRRFLRKGEGPGARVYPWSGDFDALRANTLEGRVLTTTPVGVYDNASSCGALDLSGNVWEWTRSRWGDDPQRPAFGYPYSQNLEERERLDADDYRVTRGGSWDNETSNARCAFRDRVTPDNRLSNAGCRCVLQLLA